MSGRCRIRSEDLSENAASSEEAIAIIGMSCRFAPDLDSPEKFWEFLADGKSTVSDMPEKRWKSYAASSPQATAIIRDTVLKGAFLDDIEGFDADFFGISPREADFLDPQQRFMLELTWEALAAAGVPPLSLRGSDASVYVAANSNDYGRRLLEDIPNTGAYAVNGTTFYGIANRVSYFLDLRGPSMAVDTACAGSLTALHLAAQALRAGETPIALVGGLNIMATPTLNVALNGAGAMSKDGRSKAFDTDADGYGRGEGAGVVVLKLLSDALRDNDPIQAVVRGGGIFQDGRSDGMMAPNGEAQEHMLREAYARAGIDPSTVDYVEAHGTGTPTGDGEEIKALAKVFGAGRAAGDPCLIGSVKPNIGHVEGGSGITGVIKTVLALRHEQIPPSLHNEPNPAYGWETNGLRLVGELRPWPAGEQPRRAGVSSYGVGGTIAHVILEESPALGWQDEVEQALPAADAGIRGVFGVSAMSEAGLRALAGSVADWVTEHPETPLSEIGHTLALHRSHLSQRGAVVAGSTGQLAERLRQLADGQTAPGVFSARTVSGNAADVVWVFSGHGAQWSGMGRQLLAQDAAFASTMDSLAGVFREELGWTPREAILDGGPWTAAHVQALTFAMQVGLAEVWRGHGVEPVAVIGHSVGEIAAAVAAGSLGLQEAARFACRRAVALQRLEGEGGMAMAALSFEDTRRRLATETGVEAAISASPHSTVISGDKDAIARVVERWREDGIEMRVVDTNIAFHSGHVDAVLAEVEAAAQELEPRTPKISLYSTAMTDPRSTVARDGAYWAANLRQPVRFAEAIEAALADGHRGFIEISSHPVVSHSIIETCDHLGIEDTAGTATLRRNADEIETLLSNLARMHCLGAVVDWTLDFPAGRPLDLPAAAWQHRPYWIFPEGASSAGLGSGHDPESHSLLGGRMTVSGAPSRQVWQTRLDMDTRPYPQSHGLVGVEVTPAASIINTFAEAAGEDDSPTLTDIVLRTPLAVQPPRVVQIVREGRSLSLATRIANDGAADEGDEWITHTTATIDSSAKRPTGRIDDAVIRARLPVGSLTKIDDMFANMGVEGYAFPWTLDELRRDQYEQLALMVVEPAPATRATSWAHVIDGALTISAAVVSPGDATVLWMSRSIEKVSWHGEPPARVIVHSTRSPKSPHDTVDVWVADMNGDIVCEVLGLKFAAVEHLGTEVLARDLVHEITWRPVEPAVGSEPLEQLVLVGDPDVTARLASQFADAGTPSVQVGAEPDELRPELFARPGAVLVVPSLGQPGEDVEKVAERASWTLIRTVQRVAEIQASAAGQVEPQRVWALTRGVRPASEERSVAHGPLWGISRITAGEHPELWGGAVDIDDVTGDTGSRLLDLFRGSAGRGTEDVISLTAGATEVARLSQIERSADGSPLQCSPSGTILITGGLGALGLEVARWLVDRGARRLLLAGRRGLPPRAEWDTVSDADVRRQIDSVLGLEALGVTVGAVALDITDADQVAAALAPGAHGLPPVRGVVHAAGVVNDALVDKVDQDGLRDVLAPKANGAMVLHRLFPPGELDFFVMFSSCGQFARLSGQTSYAAANSFLDTLAAHRNSGGHTETISLGWTAWRGVGLSEDIATTMFEANSRGLEAVSVAEAFRAWAFADRFQADYQAVLRVLPTPPNLPRVPMFRELTAPDEAVGDTGGQGPGLDLEGLSDSEALERVTADVREQVGAELNLDAADVELKRPLVELGVDSVMTVALRVRLQRRYGLDLPPTILWARPTVAALSEHVTEALRPAAEAEVA
ncbi:type I polyketide synthase [Amycolatopsis regifaucium]|uniref:Type I polyketide synthase n=2 Tax=Amycolatopsis regifaucium TaxID=546365 RepID=A0ABX3DUP0_9PSEU|nr:type I polyketide synthase [Amycolatopsis regifaucium]OKA08294.1 type I polyketide synthase [Amycolatopsis regifaucium]